MKSVIADSSGLISLLFPTDNNNSRAIKISKSIIEVSHRLILPGEIFTETINVVGRKQGHYKAFQVGSGLIRSKLYEMADTTSKIRDAAFKKFNEQSESVSFTDCIVMAFADEFDTKEIFGFDDVFRKKGYIRIGIDKE